MPHEFAVALPEIGSPMFTGRGLRVMRDLDLARIHGMTTDADALEALFDAIRQLIEPPEAASEAGRRQMGFHLKKPGGRYRIRRRRI